MYYIPAVLGDSAHFELCISYFYSLDLYHYLIAGKDRNV